MSHRVLGEQFYQRPWQPPAQSPDNRDQDYAQVRARRENIRKERERHPGMS